MNKSHKTCCKCRESKPRNRDFFGRDWNNADNFASMCIPCTRLATKERNAKLKEGTIKAF